MKQITYNKIPYNNGLITYYSTSIDDCILNDLDIEYIKSQIDYNIMNGFFKTINYKYIKTGIKKIDIYWDFEV